MEGSDAGGDTCFVIMPFDKKTDADGKEIDFDEIYDFVIKPAVEQVEGLACLRCDKIAEPGSIHHKMLRHISDDRVAIVDTSTLNPNVFYELGVRHALHRGVTVLIQREGTKSPFNIQGLTAINYTTSPAGVQKAKDTIGAFIKNALENPAHVDSLVYDVLPDLKVERGTRRPSRLTKVRTVEHPLVKRPECAVGFVTGDRENVKVGEIWVNSENTDMQMDRYYGRSTSATIRFLGAKKHELSGRIVEDTISDELARALDGEERVQEGNVVPTGPGELAANGVKWIFHVAAVVGQPREGYRPIERIERCVTNVFKCAGTAKFAGDPPTSILFPIFGTGAGGGDLRDHARRCIDAAVDALDSRVAPSVTRAWFSVWDDITMEACRAAVEQNADLQAGATPDGG